MVIIRHFIVSPKLIRLELKGNYISDGGYIYGKLLANGFKYSKVFRTFTKSYMDREYTDDRFIEDLQLVKDLYRDYKLEVYKLVSTESNTKGESV